VASSRRFVAGEGRTTLEWHECGAHLIERSTVDIPGVPDGISIIGCDAANGTYYQTDFDLTYTRVG
jgi:hypothetical protein